MCYIPEIQEMICDCSVTLHSLVRFYYWEKVTESGKYEARNYCENRLHEVAELRLQSTKLYMFCKSELRKQNWLNVTILFKKSVNKKVREEFNSKLVTRINFIRIWQVMTHEKRMKRLLMLISNILEWWVYKELSNSMVQTLSWVWWGWLYKM